MKPMFNPSLMCMDLLNIKEQLQILNTRADFYHVDIMDGHYVKLSLIHISGRSSTRVRKGFFQQCTGNRYLSGRQYTTIQRQTAASYSGRERGHYCHV